jgi:hypothetical protein
LFKNRINENRFFGLVQDLYRPHQFLSTRKDDAKSEIQGI